ASTSQAKSHRMRRPLAAPPVCVKPPRTPWFAVLRQVVAFDTILPRCAAWFHLQSDRAPATWHPFMLTASPDTGTKISSVTLRAPQIPSITAPGASGVRRLGGPVMRPSRLRSLPALALTAGLLSQAFAAEVPGKKGNCSAVWETGPAAVTVGNAKSTLTCTDGDST